MDYEKIQIGKNPSQELFIKAVHPYHLISSNRDTSPSSQRDTPLAVPTYRRIRRRRRNQLLIRRPTAQRDRNGKPQHRDRDNSQPHMHIGRSRHDDHRDQQEDTPRDGHNDTRKPIRQPLDFYMQTARATLPIWGGIPVCPWLGASWAGRRRLRVLRTRSRAGGAVVKAT